MVNFNNSQVSQNQILIKIQDVNPTQEFNSLENEMTRLFEIVSQKKEDTNIQSKFQLIVSVFKSIPEEKRSENTLRICMAFFKDINPESISKEEINVFIAHIKRKSIDEVLNVMKDFDLFKKIKKFQKRFAILKAVLDISSVKRDKAIGYAKSFHRKNREAFLSNIPQIAEKEWLEIYTLSKKICEGVEDLSDNEYTLFRAVAGIEQSNRNEIVEQALELCQNVKKGFARFEVLQALSDVNANRNEVVTCAKQLCEGFEDGSDISQIIKAISKVEKRDEICQQAKVFLNGIIKNADSCEVILVLTSIPQALQNDILQYSKVICDATNSGCYRAKLIHAIIDFSVSSEKIEELCKITVMLFQNHRKLEENFLSIFRALSPEDRFPVLKSIDEDPNFFLKKCSKNAVLYKIFEKDQEVFLRSQMFLS